MMKSALLALTGIVAVTTSASASSITPRADARQYNQAHRIYNGVQNGSLTFGESVRLARGQAHVARIEQRAKSDGYVGPLERARLGIAQSVQSARIYVKKHN